MDGIEESSLLPFSALLFCEASPINSGWEVDESTLILVVDMMVDDDQRHHRGSSYDKQFKAVIIGAVSRRVLVIIFLFSPSDDMMLWIR